MRGIILSSTRSSESFYATLCEDDTPYEVIERLLLYPQCIIYKRHRVFGVLYKGQYVYCLEKLLDLDLGKGTCKGSLRIAVEKSVKDMMEKIMKL